MSRTTDCVKAAVHEEATPASTLGMPDKNCAMPTRRTLLKGVAAIAGTVYGFSPALLQAAVGHYDFQFAVLPPLILDATSRLCARGGPEAAAAREAIAADLGRAADRQFDAFRHSLHATAALRALTQATQATA